MTAADRMAAMRARRREAGQCPHCGTPTEGSCGKCNTERKLRGYPVGERHPPTLDDYERIERARGRW